MDKQAKFKELMAAHELYLKGEPGAEPATFTGDWSRFDFSKTDLSYAVFKDCLLNGADFGHCILHEANFFAARLAEAKLHNVRARQADFNGCLLRDSQMNNSNFENCNFTSASLVSCDLYGSRLWGCDLSHADLTFANLTKTKLRYAQLFGTVGVRSMAFDHRGYQLVQWSMNGVRMFNAGCRCFTYQEAINHWGTKADTEHTARLYVKAVEFLNSFNDSKEGL